MLPANLDDLTPEYIQGLIDSEVAEGLRLEYKEQLPSDQSDDKRRFLYRIAGMANASGGDMLFGIVDKDGPDGQNTGIADRLSGMSIANPQKATEPLANLIRDGITPRLAGVKMKIINSSAGDVMVIRIPPSWNKPHMVTIGQVDRFYTRTSIGSSPMSIDEIRRAFSEQRDLGEAVQKWRTHRRELVEDDRGPVRLDGNFAWMFHVIPSSAFGAVALRESWAMDEKEKLSAFVPHGLRTARYNADGFICIADSGEPFKAFGYTQLFRSGITEYVDGYCCNAPPIGGSPAIFGQHLEQATVRAYQDAMNRYRRQGRNEPLYVGFSLIGVGGKSFYATAMLSITSRTAGINPYSFSSPDVFVDINEAEEPPYAETLLPLIDTMWQVGGWPGSPFKPDGTWNPFGRYD